MLPEAKLLLGFLNSGLCNVFISEHKGEFLVAKTVLKQGTVSLSPFCQTCADNEKHPVCSKMPHVHSKPPQKVCVFEHSHHGGTLHGVANHHDDPPLVVLQDPGRGALHNLTVWAQR